MKVPKAVSVLKALLLGIPVVLPDGVTYEYVQAEKDDRPKVWAIGTCVEPKQDNGEKILLDSSMTLNEFILECERMTELQWVTICANTALTIERLEKQERRERKHGDRGPSPLEKMIGDLQNLQKMEDALVDKRMRDAYPHASSVCSICGEQQFFTPAGITCKNGHGGAPSKEGSP